MHLISRWFYFRGIRGDLSPRIQKNRKYIFDKPLYYKVVLTANLKHRENLLLPPTAKYNYREIKCIYSILCPKATLQKPYNRYGYKWKRKELHPS